MKLLEVKGLETGYGRICILHGVDISVEEGEVIAVIGPNGAGKTTLVQTIAGILPNWKGSITFREHSVRDGSASVLPGLGLGYVPQDRNIFSTLTVAENLDMAAQVIKDGSVRTQRIEAAYARFPVLGRRQKQLSGTLSGGERQMLAISCALVVEPKLLILDEPTTGLAPLIQQEVIAQVLDINRGGTAILWVVEENPKSVLEHCKRVYLMESGQVRRTDTGAGLLADPRFAELFLGVG